MKRACTVTLLALAFGTVANASTADYRFERDHPGGRYRGWPDGHWECALTV